MLREVKMNVSFVDQKVNLVHGFTCQNYRFVVKIISELKLLPEICLG